jgi:hypothetical protein
VALEDDGISETTFAFECAILAQCGIVFNTCISEMSAVRIFRPGRGNVETFKLKVYTVDSFPSPQIVTRADDVA